MAEHDRFKRILDGFGEPENARKLPAHEAVKYHKRVPQALIDFWIEHGFGSYKSGFVVLCDPLAFEPVVRTIFKGDPEIDPGDVSVIAYTTSSNSLLEIWHKSGRTIGVFPNDSELTIAPTPSNVGGPFGSPPSHAHLVENSILSLLTASTDIYQEDIETVGTPSEGEVIGYVPARQIGGGDDDLQRIKAVEYFGILAQLEPFKLMELTSPEQGHPLGKFRFVRYMGTQAK